MRASRIVLAALAAVVAGSCSSLNEPPAELPDENAVGPAGGTLSAAGGKVTLVFPAGAVSTHTTITVEPAGSAPASARLLPGSAYQFGPDGITFQQPVTLTIAYDAAALPSGVGEHQLALHKVVGDTWQEVGGTVLDTAANSARVAIQGFSTYGVLGKPAPPPQADSMTVGPAGGTLIAAGGKVTITFPQGAFSENTRVSVLATTEYPSTTDAVAGTVFALEPAGGTLLRPALLSYNYDPASLPSGAGEHELGLHRATASAWVLDTGTVVDTVLNTVTVAINTLGTHGILRRPGAADAATVAYVVDTVPAGRPHYFTGLGPAVLYACGRGAAAGPPRVVLHTARAISAGAVTVSCSAHIGRSVGVGGSLAGAEGGSLHITAPAGFAMEGMSVSGTSLIDVGGFLLLRANTFAGLNTTNIVEPAAASGDPAGVARAGSLACGTGATVAANTFAAGMDMNLNANVGGDCTFDVAENQGPHLNFGGSGSLGGSSTLRYRANPVDGLTIETQVKGTAQVAVESHGSLDALNTTLHMQDTPTLAFTNNVTADAKLTLDGIGSGTVRLEGNNIQNGDFKLSVADLDLHGIGGTFGTLATELLTKNGITPELHWTQDGGDFGPFSIKAPLGAAGRDKPCDLTVGGAVYKGEVTGEFECHATVRMTDDVKLKGDVKLTVRSSALDLDATTIDAEGAVGVEAFGVEARLNALLQDGHFARGASFTGDPGIGFAVKVVDFDVDQNGIHVVRGGGGPAPRPVTTRTAPGPAPAATGDSVIVRGVRTPAGFIGNAIEVLNVQVPVLVDSVQVYASGYGVLITDATAPVRVRNSRFHGKGIVIDHASQLVTIEHDTVEVTSGSGIVLTDNGPSTIKGSRIIADGFGSTGLTVTNTVVTLENDTIIANGAFGIVLNNAGASRILNSRVTVGGVGGIGIFLNDRGQALIQGSQITVNTDGTAVISVGTSPTIENSILTAPAVVFTAMNGGRAVLTGNTIAGTVNVATFMRLAGNTFTSGNVADAGFLLNDPMGNSGLDPETDIQSPIDFDGNQCQDYPPAANQKDDEGNCSTYGIPIPADPGPTTSPQAGAPALIPSRRRP